MLVGMNERNELIVSPEDEIERYALAHWLEEFEIADKVVIETQIEQYDFGFKKSRKGGE